MLFLLVIFISPPFFYYVPIDPGRHVLAYRMPFCVCSLPGYNSYVYDFDIDRTLSVSVKGMIYIWPSLFAYLVVIKYMNQSV